MKKHTKKPKINNPINSDIENFAEKRLKEKRLSHELVWSKYDEFENDLFLIKSGFEDFFKKYGCPKNIDSRDFDNSWHVLDYTDEQMLTFNILNDLKKIIDNK